MVLLSFLIPLIHTECLASCITILPVCMKKGTMRDIYDWDSGKYLGQIKEARQTYNVVGNMNEFQVTIGETTFGWTGGIG